MEIDEARMLELTEKMSNIVSSFLSILLIMQLFGDLLGVNVVELLKSAITRPWVIPTEWIARYYPIWYGMQWALLILMLSDQVFTMRYMQLHGNPPPPAYERWMSLAIFMISFWLTLLFRYATFTVITIFASISFSYCMFIRKK